VTVHGDDALLDGVLGHQSVDGDGPLMCHAVRAIGGLVLCGGVPPGVQDDDVVCLGEV
jgi:hypothetical protein